MATYVQTLTLAATAAFVVTGVQATQTNQLAFPFTRTAAFARVDPIVNPGQVAPHVHKFLGASNVPANAKYEDLQKSECTTHPISSDLSSYWMPALYHVGEDGYKLLDSGNNIVYYGTNGDDVQAFPDGFQMVSGTPAQTCEEGPDRYFVCIDENGNGEHSTFLPQKECAEIGMHLTFPSCWDGKDFSSETQNEHLVMPIGGALEKNCPKSHSIKLPSLMMDMFGNSTGLPKNPNGPTFALSFNDTKGCGLHGDFISGWDRSVLQAAMDECKDFNGDMDVATCKPLSKYYQNRDITATCKFQSAVPKEDVGVTGDLLKSLIYCSPEDTSEQCEKKNEGISFVDTKTITVLGVPLPLPILGGADDEEETTSSKPPAEETKTTSDEKPESTDSVFWNSHSSSEVKTSSATTSSEPKPTTSVRAEVSSSSSSRVVKTVRPSSSALPTTSSDPKPTTSSDPKPTTSSSGNPHSGSDSSPWGEGVPWGGSDTPIADGHDGPSWRLPPGIDLPDILSGDGWASIFGGSSSSKGSAHRRQEGKSRLR